MSDSARARRPRVFVLEVVRDREDQRDQRLVVVRVDPQDVFADALALLRLVQQAVALGFRERGRHRGR